MAFRSAAWPLSIRMMASSRRGASALFSPPARGRGAPTRHTARRPAAVGDPHGALADTLYDRIPAGLGSTGALRLSPRDMDAMLAGGASWAQKIGYGRAEDLDRIEERGRMAGADP